jgi:beta-glucosidase/6-phospho-beta-glucosidase/beta-galactosidase
MFSPSLFRSYFLAGFECSTHRRCDGRRLDLVAATHHDRLAAQDYWQLAGLGIRTVRDGFRWHLIEPSPGRYDWSSLLPMLRAANDAKVQVIWDLCHYGWPDDIEIWSSAFIERFAEFAGAAARRIRDETDAVPLFCPVNEISYWSWAGAQVGRFNPCLRGRGGELKRQLVRASIAAIEAIWSIDRRARIVHIDPVINVIASPKRPRERRQAEAYRNAQFEGWDMLAGFMAPELGGRPEYVDIVGVNYYSDNQWMLGGPTVELGHPLYRPFRDILTETYARYGRPIFVAETGAEGRVQPAWLRYVSAEVRAAIIGGVPVEGVCLYPVLHYPGWVDGRHCECGLLGYAGESDRRAVDEPLADELRRQQAILANLFGARRSPADEMLAAR